LQPSPLRSLSRWTSALRALIILAILTALAVPAAAQSGDPEADRRANQERQRQVDEQLDAATASEEQLRIELERLDREVTAGEIRTAAAKEEQATAEHQVVELANQVAEAEASAAEARRKAAQQAVQAYMRPDRESATAVLAARSPQEMGKMKALVSEVAQHHNEIIRNRVVAENLLRQKKADAETAQERARQAAAQAEAELASTTQRRQQQAVVREEMQRRINHLRDEQAALDAQEEQIVALLAERRRQQEAAARRATTTAAPPPPASSPSGGSSSSGYIWPAKGTMTSGYGARWGTVHKGIDVAAPTGTPIWAAKAGEVIYASWMSGYGNVVMIDHGGDVTTLYAHQSRIASSVGQSVAQGQVIGYIGSTGNSTGPHLHFEIRFGGVPRDPAPYLP
jgi:murein DD-endopeptidase MepM/ murein hydrolase activator NlpD